MEKGKRLRENRYYHNNIESLRKVHNDYNKTQKGKYSEYKSAAKRMGRTFDLTFEQFISFWNTICYYCGLDIDGIGLDRFNNDIGYTIDNIVSCCCVCNRMKRSATHERFIERCNLIANRYPTVVELI